VTDLPDDIARRLALEINALIANAYQQSVPFIAIIARPDIAPDGYRLHFISSLAPPECFGMLDDAAAAVRAGEMRGMRLTPLGDS
jgi:hypothetical protein